MKTPLLNRVTNKVDLKKKDKQNQQIEIDQEEEESKVYLNVSEIRQKLEQIRSILREKYAQVARKECIIQ
ncbi:MAG: hypothetical protein EZS28_055542 [Streblomastix strix]|uniref:Uncharacterized protein n=1 Tax=Streblomastix strix TaxID=222440 RepID=A0A5J4PYK8_9EUKA|nr:MAG: hypothetical protein EZS28_055542 [Streblomastix strix]